MVKLLPPLIVTDEQIDRAMRIISDCVDAVVDQLGRGAPRRRTGGPLVIVRSLDSIVGTDADVGGETWTSRRLLLAP